VSYQDRISWSLRNSSEAAPVFPRLRRWDGISAEFTNISGACQLGYRIETQAAYLALHDLSGLRVKQSLTDLRVRPAKIRVTH
jgi:hypothetical protein